MYFFWTHWHKQHENQLTLSGDIGCWTQATELQPNVGPVLTVDSLIGIQGGFLTGASGQIWVNIYKKNAIKDHPTNAAICRKEEINHGKPPVAFFFWTTPPKFS